MGYANFKDPIGLLERMLTSGNRTAYSVLFREALNKILVPIDVLLQSRERKKLQKPQEPSKHPIILVLGGSRSGTTLMYQTLARHLSVGYISNFISAFQRSPISAYSLFNTMVPKAKGDFQNFFGSVSGLGGPNDAFFLWNRWLGDDRNNVPKEISPKSRSEMQRFFNTWLNVSEKPFLNKNNRNSLCAATLDAVFDNIFFVEIHRDPVYVAQSLIQSRRKVQGSEKLGWGLLSEDSRDTGDPLQYIDDVCNQVFRVDTALASQRNKISTDNYIRVSYEDFCENPAATVEKIGHMANVDITAPKHLAELTFSKSSNGQRLDDKKFKRILTCIERFYGHKL